MKKPDRFIILAITTVMAMIVFTLLGEGHRREAAENALKKPAAPLSSPVMTPIPVPETPKPDQPKTK